MSLGRQLASASRRYSSYPASKTIRQNSLQDLYKLHKNKEPITVITAHDYITGRFAEASPGIDAILVGDSLSMVAKGHPSTLELDFDDFYHSTASVLRAVREKFVIVDMPFGSFEESVEQCTRSAVKLMKLGKVGSVKIEGSYEMTDRIRSLTNAGIPVTGHIGLQPQKFNMLGGFKAQGRNALGALDIYKQALHLQKIGCKMLLFECIPEKVAAFITDRVDVPTIGIGAGNSTSGQVLVMADALGMSDGKKAKFVKSYLDINSLAVDALTRYSADVKSKSFPNSELHTYPMKDEEFDEFERMAKDL
ncbi:hypothetical protein PICMEDRAFT_71973 [Pichia membranifaciens NRRL Y-2026]|uniref:3-methyl-2-oxobutanoate hydroxymethyltransferase n=1 Tax=Pichia membranifaciens NRRL Y-2026 TaxID=763406 RepID=A0A1E3NPD0_9ASCO|nr:hypothetical protein PICMEDRAFT_71973 [Pichia membranifaciens NRRL Y-2026]ODQ47970.1 hypothetical protein PICMEDRAFT_71973 [Pichia membranifaciens NRRL Y-2026]